MAYTDQEILAAIRSGDDDKVLGHLYKTFLPKIRSMILKNSGNEDEAQDIFQDAILAFYKQVKTGKFKEQYQIGAFIYSVSRNLWINYIKKKNRSVSISEKEYLIPLEEDVLKDMITKEREQKVMEVFSQIGERCQELLTYSIFRKYSMKEICERMGFSTENAAKTRNYKCKQKLIRLVKDNQSLKKFLQG